MPDRLRLFTPDAQYPDDGTIERLTAGENVVFDIFRERSPDKLPKDLLAETDGIVIWHEMAVDEAFVSLIPRCRIIVRAGVGFDHIDLEATGALGLPVCNTPDYGTSANIDTISTSVKRNGGGDGRPSIGMRMTLCEQAEFACQICH